jgi:Trypsin-like peptidase domain
MPIKAVDYILPLVIGKKDSKSPYDRLTRFAGTGFYIGANGVIATCDHIVASLDGDEILMAYDINLNRFIELTEIRSHPEMDFALARIGVRNNKYLKLVRTDKHPIELGTDVSSFGYINAGRVGSDLRLEDKYFKGYISFIGNKPDPAMKCRTVCELSFPSLTGFSGAPVYFTNKRALIGMLYGNRATNIELFSHSVVEKNGATKKDKIFRTMEFGLMHTVNDIVVFLEDMGIKVKSG